MALAVWTSSDGDWGNTASWSTGVVPVSNDTVYFDGTSQVDVTAGLNQTAVDLDVLWLKSTNRASLGTSGGYLQIAADKCVLEGSGDHFLDSVAAAFDYVSVDMNGGTVALDGTVARVFGKRGDVSILGSLVISNLFSLDVGFKATILTGVAATMEKLFVEAGQVVVSKAPDNAYISGGIVTYDTSASPGTMLMTGGLVIYKPTTIAVLSRLWVLGGVFDTRKLNQPITITVRVIGPLGMVLDGSALSVTLDLDLRNPVP